MIVLTMQNKHLIKDLVPVVAKTNYFCPYVLLLLSIRKFTTQVSFAGAEQNSPACISGFFPYCNYLNKNIGCFFKFYQPDFPCCYCNSQEDICFDFISNKKACITQCENAMHSHGPMPHITEGILSLQRCIEHTYGKTEFSLLKS